MRRLGHTKVRSCPFGVLFFVWGKANERFQWRRGSQWTEGSWKIIVILKGLLVRLEGISFQRFYVPTVFLFVSFFFLSFFRPGDVLHGTRFSMSCFDGVPANNRQPSPVSTRVAEQLCCRVCRSDVLVF